MGLQVTETHQVSLVSSRAAELQAACAQPHSHPWQPSGSQLAQPLPLSTSSLNSLVGPSSFFCFISKTGLHSVTEQALNSLCSSG